MKTISLTGATGNMGKEALVQLMDSPAVSKVKILVLPRKKDKAIARKWQKRYGDKLEVILGSVSSFDDCIRLVEGADYVFNLAAVIPPKSDASPHLAKFCNVDGARNMVKAVERANPEPKYVHCSTVAVYGNRNYKHPWGRVGDPLLPSVYDCYASQKVLGERAVLDSKIKTWAVLRQTAMLHNNMLTDNMKDGLMFHTCFNTPLEWVTARDSGRLIVKIVEKDVVGECEVFWKKVWNIGGGHPNRLTGFDTFDEGFRLIGGTGEEYLKPTWHSVRNFHGLWFYDSDSLNDVFDFQRDTTVDYWKDILVRHKYYTLAKLLPKSLIRRVAIQRLLIDDNAPRKWILSGQSGKVKAYFGAFDNILCLPEKWSEYPLLSKGQVPGGDIDYEALRDKSKVTKDMLLSHGYDEEKADSDLDIEDMKMAAEFRGGKCLSDSMVRGDLYTPLTWQCHDGHVFTASPYTVIKAGHWCDQCYQLNVWDFDRQSKHNPFYAQVWYDTHAKGEDTYYYFDHKYNAKYKALDLKGERQ